MIFTGTFIPVAFTIYFCIKRYQELQEDKSQDIYNETRRNIDIESHELQPSYVSDIYAQVERIKKSGVNYSLFNDLFANGSHIFTGALRMSIKK